MKNIRYIAFLLLYMQHMHLTHPWPSPSVPGVWGSSLSVVSNYVNRYTAQASFAPSTVKPPEQFVAPAKPIGLDDAVAKAPGSVTSWIAENPVKSFLAGACVGSLLLLYSFKKTNDFILKYKTLLKNNNWLFVLREQDCDTFIQRYCNNLDNIDNFSTLVLEFHKQTDQLLGMNFVWFPAKIQVLRDQARVSKIYDEKVKPIKDRLEKKESDLVKTIIDNYQMIKSVDLYNTELGLQSINCNIESLKQYLNYFEDGSSDAIWWKSLLTLEGTGINKSNINSLLSKWESLQREVVGISFLGELKERAEAFMQDITTDSAESICHLIKITAITYKYDIIFENKVNEKLVIQNLQINGKAVE